MRRRIDSPLPDLAGAIRTENDLSQARIAWQHRLGREDAGSTELHAAGDRFC